MKIKNLIRTVIFLMLLIFVIIVVQTSKRADAERKKEILNQQLQKKALNNLLGDIEVAENREDYYSVIKLSKELLNTGYTNELINLKITDAEQKIVKLELAPIVSKAKDFYKTIKTLKGVIPYYTLQIESIDENLENAKDYEFSKDYNLAMDEYLDVIKQCQALQTLEVKRLGILKNRRSALRLNMNIETSFKDANSNDDYIQGQEYLKRAELAYQLAKFDSAQSDYNAAVSNMKQSLDFLTQQKDFKVAQQRWESKVFNAVKAAKADSVDEFYDFMELYSSGKWTNLKSEISSAELAASTNNFSEAVIIYKNSLAAFDDVLNTVNVNKDNADKQKLEEAKKRAEELESKEPVKTIVEEILNEKLVINAGKPFDMMLSSNVVISMLPIKSGSCSLDGYVEKGDKRIQYKIVLTDNFWCSKSETTLAMFLEFLNAKGIQDGIEISQFGPFIKNKNDKLVLSKNKYSRSDQQPVFCVDWNIALKFCEWLNEISKGKRPSDYIFRLPTEAEWIYSAMYEGDTTEEATLDSIAWYSKNSSSTSHRVCSLKPNEFGLYDMYGNVWEWCLDSYSPDFIKSNQPVSTNLVCTAATNKRVVKGGSWDFTEKALKPLGNMGFDKSAKQNAIGFRVVLAPQI